ncbi:precorrin-3B C(17)-methyltransferase [Streptomyces chrestomyceticus JCM 4735]|uniref:Precorrin-3B C(17)-methyltransferase n=1 Tax=Streptomyces chrestomyceticus JCM 4735 TaxID=1306181 RepID=A0A7U9L1F0_9ACTN|nr:cobalamin biosynthesis protein [Streptomyces chrestomyceticus]GCD38612.1 precorrin-3B C(17)-methyltransferase [Streptomyces chrestomyceticus JCM 4735]
MNAAPIVAGVGARRGVPAAEVLTLVLDTLAAAGTVPEALTALATVDTKASEPGLTQAAARLGVPLLAYPAEVLAAVPVPHPSAAALTATGTPSVAEAAALTGADALTTGAPGTARLLVGKRTSGPGARATCAVAHGRTPHHLCTKETS